MALWNRWFGFANDEVFDEGMAAYDRGDYEQAIEAFESCIEECGPREARLSKFYTAQSYAELGHECARAGDAAGAMRCYEKALRFYPNFPDLNLAMAKACRQLGARHLQDGHVARALESNPRFVDAILFQGITWYECGRHEEGLARVERACRLDPHMNMSQFRLAHEAHAKGDLQRAVELLLSMCCTSSLDAALHLRVGDSFMRDHAYEAAIDEYYKALAVAPDYADGHCRLGKALVTLKRYDEAVMHLNSCIRLNPGNAEAHAQLAIAYDGLQRSRDFGRELHELVALAPDHPVAMRYQTGYAV
ncbi:MAG TPA: tetratricopeptide repeat protein [Fimbriimonas sp.]|nr:tetratricopeptide repeat protein [Fimbriimonas sp.]